MLRHAVRVCIPVALMMAGAVCAALLLTLAPAFAAAGELPKEVMRSMPKSSVTMAQSASTSAMRAEGRV